MPEPYAAPPILLLWDPARIKQPYRPVGMPSEFLIAIALIVISWDAFEQAFDKLLFAIVAATKTDNLEELGGRNFRKRRSAMRRLSRQLFGANDVAAYIDRIIEDSC